jgi:hypothetical protein
MREKAIIYEGIIRTTGKLARNALQKGVSGQNSTSPAMLRWTEQQPELRPMWVVAKVYGRLRKNMYYSKYSKTMKSKYPLPRMDELIGNLSRTQHFSAPDFTSEYNHFTLAASDVPTTACKVSVLLYPRR